MCNYFSPESSNPPSPAARTICPRRATKSANCLVNSQIFRNFAAELTKNTYCLSKHHYS